MERPYGGPYGDYVLRDDGQRSLLSDVHDPRPLTRTPRATFPVSDALAARLRERFDELPLPAQAALQRAHDLGHDVFIVGGVPRDVLLGRPARDLDLTGSVPLVQISALLSTTWLAARPRNIPALTEYRPPVPNISRNGVVHVYVPSTTARGMGDWNKLFEYAAMRIGWELYGTELGDDLAWRDVRHNILCFDPFEQVLLAADPGALQDLGYDTDDLRNWTEPRCSEPTAIVPIDLPPGEERPRFFVAKAVARIIKAMCACQNKMAWAPIADWISRQENVDWEEEFGGRRMFSHLGQYFEHEDGQPLFRAVEHCVDWFTTVDPSLGQAVRRSVLGEHTPKLPDAGWLYVWGQYQAGEPIDPRLTRRVPTGLEMVAEVVGSDHRRLEVIGHVPEPDDPANALWWYDQWVRGLPQAYLTVHENGEPVTVHAYLGDGCAYITRTGDGGLRTFEYDENFLR